MNGGYTQDTVSDDGMKMRRKGGGGISKTTTNTQV